MNILAQKILFLFPVLLLVAAAPQEPQPAPNDKCCRPAKVLLGGAVPSALCSRTECLPNTAPHGLASCGGLIASDAVVNAKCENKDGAFCDPNGMVAKSHLSNQIYCEFQECTPADGGNGSKCVVTPAPNEPPVAMPFNDCPANFTKC